MIQLEPKQQVTRHPEGRHHSCQPFDSASLSVALHNEHIHLENPENFLKANPHVPALLQASPVTAVRAGAGGFMTEAYPICTANVEKAGQLPHA